MRQAVCIAALLACEDTRSLSDFGTFQVNLYGERGTAKEPLDFAIDAVPFTVDIEANYPYRDSVLIEVLPAGRTERIRQSVKLDENGRAQDIPIGIELAFGEIRVVATDVGYEPVDPLEALCNNKDRDGNPIDDDGDRLANDYDPGCFAPDDNSESAGSGSSGASEPIYFANPRVEDVQSSTTTVSSPLEGFRVTLDKGELVVIHRTNDGFYFADVEGAETAADLSWRGAFAFNFQTPLENPRSDDLVQRGDCLSWVAGTVQEFFGFTELVFPNWRVPGDCRHLLPEPVLLHSLQPDDSAAMEPYESGLVRVENLRVAMELRACDLNGDTELNYDVPEEAECSNDCGDDPQCGVLEHLINEKQWTAQLGDGVGAEINIVSFDANPDWNPMDHLGESISQITGVLRHLSFGRPEWILIPRDETDFNP